MEHHGQDGIELHFSLVDLDHRLVLLATLDLLGLLDECLLVELILETLELDAIEDHLQVHHIRGLYVGSIGLATSHSSSSLMRFRGFALFSLLSSVPLLLAALFQRFGLVDEILHRDVFEIQDSRVHVH